jgi:Tfp pilus assembly protein PilF
LRIIPQTSSKDQEGKNMATNRIPSIEEALQYAVTAIKRSDLNTGKAALSWVLKREPSNIVAWTWMTACVSDHDVLSECHRRVSALDPFP